MKGNKEIKRLIKQDGKNYIVDFETKVISCPSSVKPNKYPSEILEYIREYKYLIQLNIE